MKYAKKNQVNPLLKVIALVAAVIVVLVLILVLAGNSGSDPQETTAATNQTQDSNPGGNTGSTDPSGDGDVTDTTDGTEDSVTTDPEESETTGETKNTEETTKATEETQETTKATEPTTQPTTPPSTEDLRIETPYATLVYPGQWRSQVDVQINEGNPYRVTFTAKLASGVRQDLFIISFGGSTNGSVGVVNVDGEEVPVHVSIEDIQPASNWSASDVQTINSMQECLNDVLACIDLASPQEKPQETQPEVTLPENNDAMIIETPYGDLQYPAGWKNYLDLKIEDQGTYRVEFRCKMDGHAPMALFVVYFGGDKGVTVGTAKDSNGQSVEIRLEVLDLNFDSSWDEGEKRMAAAMQEDLNFVLLHLT